MELALPAAAECSLLDLIFVERSSIDLLRNDGGVFCLDLRPTF
jgi:hypothetical protein